MARPKIEIYGVPNNLKFELFNLANHLYEGGLVQLVFNGNGTHMEVTKIEICNKQITPSSEGCA